MSDPFSPERKTVRLEKQNLFGSGYAGLGLFWNCGPVHYVEHLEAPR
jgi:hypothetical protein